MNGGLEGSQAETGLLQEETSYMGRAAVESRSSRVEVAAKSVPVEDREARRWRCGGLIDGLEVRVCM